MIDSSRHSNMDYCTTTVQYFEVFASRIEQTQRLSSSGSMNLKVLRTSSITMLLLFYYYYCLSTRHNTVVNRHVWSSLDV